MTKFLGRERYARADGDAAIYRNGHEPRTVKTTSGSIELKRPRIRNAAELGVESQVLGKGVARTHALEALIILGFLRGLSVRDVEALPEEALGSRESYKSWLDFGRDLKARGMRPPALLDRRRRPRASGRPR